LLIQSFGILSFSVRPLSQIRILFFQLFQIHAGHRFNIFFETIFEARDTILDKVYGIWVFGKNADEAVKDDQRAFCFHVVVFGELCQISSQVFSE